MRVIRLIRGLFISWFRPQARLGSSHPGARDTLTARRPAHSIHRIAKEPHGMKKKRRGTLTKRESKPMALSVAKPGHGLQSHSAILVDS
jgi:hypothetical protein